MIIKITNELSYNTDSEALMLLDKEIGYVNISLYDNQAEMYIFIEEEYRFHKFSLILSHIMFYLYKTYKKNKKKLR